MTHSLLAQRRVRWSLRSVLVALVAGVLMLATTMAARADVVAQNSGVRGRADWNWNSNGTRLDNLTFGVRDLLCDGNDVYVQLRVTRSDGAEVPTERRYNKQDCPNAENFGPTYYQSNFYIVRVRVAACVDDAGFNRCALSEWHDNPYT